MHTRVVTFAGVKDFEAGIALVRDEVLPVLNEYKGYRGTTVSADRSGGVLGVLSLWDTAADREASFGALAKARQRGVEITGAEMTIESFEELVADINEVPAVGSALMVTRISMDPAQDRSEPRILQDPGPSADQGQRWFPGPSEHDEP